MNHRESESASRLVGVAVDSLASRFIYIYTQKSPIYTPKRALYIHPKEPYILIWTPAQDDDMSAGLFPKEPYIYTQKSPIYTQKSPIYMSGLVGVAVDSLASLWTGWRLNSSLHLIKV